jgi:hypothetical protein
MKHKIQIIDNFLDEPLTYKNSKDPQPTQEISNKIAHSLQSNIILDTTQVEADYIAVLYLDFPTECVNKKAVSFWLHKETLDEEYPNETKMKWLGIQSMEEGYKFDEKEYEKYMEYFVKYNRLILFDANLFYTDGEEGDSRKFFVKINNQ